MSRTGFFSISSCSRLVAAAGLAWSFTAAAPCAGQVSGKFVVRIMDNVSMDGPGNGYTLTPDSVLIAGDSDYGRRRLDYSGRPLTRKERKKLESFLKKFPFDSLEDTYAVDPASAAYRAGVIPRVIEISGSVSGRSFYSKMTGCYAYQVARFCEFMNGFFPPEVRIELNPADFQIHRP